MDVKVANRIHRGMNELVMVKLTDQDKWNIAHMAPDATVYAMYPMELYPVDEVFRELEIFKGEV